MAGVASPGVGTKHVPDFTGMCMQCMIGAMTAGAGATGMRSWLKHVAPRWLTPKRMKAVSFALVGAALLASTVLLGGSSTA